MGSANYRSGSLTGEKIRTLSADAAPDDLYQRVCSPGQPVDGDSLVVPVEHVGESQRGRKHERDESIPLDAEGGERLGVGESLQGERHQRSVGRTLGHDFVPAGIHAGGLRYHGDAASLSMLVNKGEIDAVAVHQRTCFDAAVQFAKSEGILPAPESSHAIRVAIDEALEAKNAGRDKTVLFNLSGHGHFDLTAYEAYLAGDLEDYDYAAGSMCEGE